MGLHLVTGRSGFEHITPSDHGAFHNALLISGSYVLNTGNKFAASVITSNSIRISDGELIMQGRHVRLAPGEIVNVTIENGAQDYKRNDLIVARYVKDGTTGVESVNFVVIQGTPGTTATDPAYNTGNILNGALKADFPLYRVPLDGLTVGTPVRLFETKDNFDARITALLASLTNVINGTTKVAKAAAADTATSATSATKAASADKATADANGKNIASTYATNTYVQQILAGIESGTTPTGNAAALGGKTSAEWQAELDEKLTDLDLVGLNKVRIMPSGTDLNDCLEIGLYYFPDLVTKFVNVPDTKAHNGLMVVGSHNITQKDNERLFQLYFSTNTGVAYFRTSNGSETSWKPWKTIATTADLANYLPLDGSKAMNGNLYVGTSSNTNSIMNILRNVKRQVYQVIDTDGVYNLYDSTNSNMIIRSSADGGNNFYGTLNGTATGNLPLTGGTLNGALALKTYDNGVAQIHKSHSDTADYGTCITDKTKDGTVALLIVQANQGKAYFRANDGVSKELLHAGNSAKVVVSSTPLTAEGSVRIW